MPGGLGARGKKERGRKGNTGQVIDGDGQRSFGGSKLATSVSPRGRDPRMDEGKIKNNAVQGFGATPEAARNEERGDLGGRTCGQEGNHEIEKLTHSEENGTLIHLLIRKGGGKKKGLGGLLRGVVRGSPKVLFALAA